MTAILSTKQFDFNRETNTFSAEISMLDEGGRKNIWHRAFSDACDEGLKVMSHKTGKEVMYYVHHTDTFEGEIQGWHLLPTKESIRQVPECAGTKLFVMND